MKKTGLIVMMLTLLCCLPAQAQFGGIIKKAKENDVVLTGFIKGRKLHSLLTNASCYCLPSSHEGLPIALLEAMSYNIPVVVSDIPANLEIGLDESFYFPCGNIEMLANRLEEKVHLSQKPLYDMQLYNWDIIAKQTAEIYDKTVCELC